MHLSEEMWGMREGGGGALRDEYFIVNLLNVARTRLSNFELSKSIVRVNDGYNILERILIHIPYCGQLNQIQLKSRHTYLSPCLRNYLPIYLYTYLSTFLPTTTYIYTYLPTYYKPHIYLPPTYLPPT